MEILDSLIRDLERNLRLAEERGTIDSFRIRKPELTLITEHLKQYQTLMQTFEAVARRSEKAEDAYHPSDEGPNQGKYSGKSGENPFEGTGWDDLFRNEFKNSFKSSFYQQYYHTSPPPNAPSLRPWYEVLGIRQTATKVEILKAYRSLAMRHHPDRPGGNAAKMQEINVAKDEAMQGRG